MSITSDAQKFLVKTTTEPIGGEDGHRSFLGKADEAANLIVVDGTMPRTRQEEVLMHELVHLTDMAMPEQLVMQMGTRLFGILRANGLLVGNLMAKVVDGTLTKAEAEAVNRESNEMARGPVLMLGRAGGPQYRVSEAPWDGAASRYTIEEWRRATLIHLDGVDPELKASHKLPVREPNGDLSRAGSHAAAAVLGGARGGVDAPMAKKRAAARALARIYRQELEEEPPESLAQVAGA